MNRRRHSHHHPFDTIQYVDIAPISVRKRPQDGRKTADGKANDRERPDRFCAYVATPKNVARIDSEKRSRNQGAPALFFCLHGAGCTSMTWAPLVEKLSEEHYVVAFDARAHGRTRTSDASSLALSALSSDALHVLGATISKLKRPKGFPPVSVVLVGHSMGGAVATALARLVEIERCDAFRVVGCAIVEMVGKTALASADRNEAYLRDRPKQFATLEDAVRWSCRSGFVTNRRSAAMSVPSCLVRFERGTEAESSSYVWRTDVLSTKPFWNDWFDDLSDRFLSLRIPKLVILSHAGKLDTPMTIAHMSGKIQLRVVREGGHMVHENFPGVVGNMFVEFAKRSVKVGRFTIADAASSVPKARYADSSATKPVSSRLDPKSAAASKTKRATPILIVAPDKKRSGNASTSRRLAGVLESVCGACVIVRAPTVSVRDALAELEEVEPRMLVCVHAVKSSSFLDIAESRRPPTVLVFGGTDLNVDAKNDAIIEADIRRRVRGCACVVSFTSEMTLDSPIDGARVRVIPHGVKIAPTTKAVETDAEALYRDFTNGNKKKRVLLLLAGIRPVKDVCYLVDRVEAAFESCSTLRDHILVIAGPIIDEAYARLVRERTKGAKRVRFAPGGIEHNVACALLRRCAALVNSSISEGSSVAMKEARAMGVPVFARDIPGNRATLQQLATLAPGGEAVSVEEDKDTPFKRVSWGTWLYRDPRGFVASLRDYLAAPHEMRARGKTEGPSNIEALNKIEEAGWKKIYDEIGGKAGAGSCSAR